MKSAQASRILFAVLLAAMLVVSAAAPAFARERHHEHDWNNDSNSQEEQSMLYQFCHNGIDDDEDGYIDLLDNDCAQFRPVCPSGEHANEVFECVPNDAEDPICAAPQVLVNHICVDPEPLVCTAPQIPNNTQTLCVDPAPTCLGAQTLVENQCVDPVCSSNQALNAETHMCVDSPVVPTCTDAQHLENNVCIDNPVIPPTDTPSGNSGSSNGGGNGGGGNGPIMGSLGNGGSLIPGNGPISGSVLGANSSNLPELPAGCTALIGSYMRMGKHNDSEQVKKLQKFLSENLGIDLPETGFFGPATDEAVRRFQKNHESQVLTPWGISDATGYVYKTTSRWINLTACASLVIPMPELN